MTTANVVRTERGWGGHFICADRCRFRRNTLLEGANGTRIVVSTVGVLIVEEGQAPQEIGAWHRMYETMAFHAQQDGIYWDANVGRPVSFDSEWGVNEFSETSDQKANDMHETVVTEIARRLEAGDRFPKEEG